MQWKSNHKKPCFFSGTIINVVFWLKLMDNVLSISLLRCPRLAILLKLTAVVHHRQIKLTTTTNLLAQKSTTTQNPLTPGGGENLLVLITIIIITIHIYYRFVNYLYILLKSTKQKRKKITIFTTTKTHNFFNFLTNFMGIKKILI